VIAQVLEATTELLEVGGASIVSGRHRLDRHWRNARTVAVHNPLIYKQQAVGAYLLDGDPLPYAWSAGRRG
jgi:alkylation response protein AidB-like acyl-CoA dehydrogenase